MELYIRNQKMLNLVVNNGKMDKCRCAVGLICKFCLGKEIGKERVKEFFNIIRESKDE